MFDKDFYPTPNEVIEKMLAPYMTNSREYINEKYVFGNFGCFYRYLRG